MNAFGETGEGSERADFDLCRRKLKFPKMGTSPKIGEPQSPIVPVTGIGLGFLGQIGLFGKKRKMNR